MYIRKYLLLLSGVLVFNLSAMAQQKDETSLTNADTTRNYSKYKRKLTFGGVLQSRYLLALTKNTDINGKNFDPLVTKGITNTFMTKRARVMVQATINDHFSANILANLSEFNSDPTNKVLENAYIRYTLNKYFHVQAGQFRPFFGIEDALAADIIRTLDFSNQYYSFGKNGWQSFQTGISLFGSIISNSKLRYFAGIYNGNNRNQVSDDNNTKNLYARVEADAAAGVTIGINVGTGSLGQSGTGNALGVDATAKIKIIGKWELLLMGEYKSGSNFIEYNSSVAEPKLALNQFRMQGFYFFPTIRYNNNTRRLRAIEFSSRYEYLDENYKISSNARQTIIPNVSLIFADDFYAALQVGVSMDMYNRDVPLTATYTRSLAYAQLQIRF